MMLEKVLVANRGEIAVRIIKACQEMGIKTVAVYSDVDEKAPHVRMADQAVGLGDPTPSESYLNIPKMIEAAQSTGADAIHPGYGFLAENPDFAHSCEAVDIKFIGPKSEIIADMGNKIRAKKVMENSGIPIIPGYHGEKQDISTLTAAGKKIGFPLMVKATSGGGGKGMKIVRSEEDLKSAIEGSQREAKSSFGDESVYLERYLDEPRHIEIQILADEHGNTVHLNERDCSIQRRHQKIIEETPSPAVDDELRKEMGDAAVKAAKAVGYTNAGTVEFMVDSKLNYYFLEMNTRVQVEHPITEATTSIDIVKWQLKIASGMELTVSQDEVKPHGHAMECRIYAEDPSKGFLPCTGTLKRMKVPSGPNIRNDLGIEEGMEITPYYDPMLGKLIVKGENRHESIEKMRWALSRYMVLGITTNIPFLRAIMNNEHFQDGNITTHFIERYLSDWTDVKAELPTEAIIALAVYDQMHPKREEVVKYKETDPHSPWKFGGKWRVGV
ncbi:MAG: acetyl-CoA carboxylase biotin carboxylase subunit [Thermoplasmata archaeon]